MICQCKCHTKTDLERLPKPSRNISHSWHISKGTTFVYPRLKPAKSFQINQANLNLRKRLLLNTKESSSGSLSSRKLSDHDFRLEGNSFLKAEIEMLQLLFEGRVKMTQHKEIIWIEVSFVKPYQFVTTKEKIGKSGG